MLAVLAGAEANGSGPWVLHDTWCVSAVGAPAFPYHIPPPSLTAHTQGAIECADASPASFLSSCLRTVSNAFAGALQTGNKKSATSWPTKNLQACWLSPGAMASCSFWQLVGTSNAALTWGQPLTAKTASWSVWPPCLQPGAARHHACCSPNTTAYDRPVEPALPCSWASCSFGDPDEGPGLMCQVTSC